MEDLHPGGDHRGKTLIDSSQLRNSIQVTADASGFAVGTNAKHAATHQFGDQGRTIRARKAKNLRFQVGGQWVSKKQVKVNIPKPGNIRTVLGIIIDGNNNIFRRWILHHR